MAAVPGPAGRAEGEPIPRTPSGGVEMSTGPGREGAEGLTWTMFSCTWGCQTCLVAAPLTELETKAPRSGICSSPHGFCAFIPSFGLVPGPAFCQQLEGSGGSWPFPVLPVSPPPPRASGLGSHSGETKSGSLPPGAVIGGKLVSGAPSAGWSVSHWGPGSFRKGLDYGREGRKALPTLGYPGKTKQGKSWL